MPASSSSADRNLLFGILAMQMEFITPAGLIAALNAWVLQKSKPLSELLVELGHLAAEVRDVLEKMVDLHVAQHGGRAEQSLAALSSVSDVAAELRELNDPDVQQSLGHIAAPTSRETGVLSDVVAADAANAAALGTMDEADATFLQIPPLVLETQPEQPRPASRYVLLRPHAEGGLGKVWIARDRELNREVAFKEIKAKRAQDKNSRGRFLMEAEITGGLEHPGIVPVYGLGHFEDGRPFYAMRFIRGHSLREAIQQFHHSRHAPRAEGRTTAGAIRTNEARTTDHSNSTPGFRHVERDGDFSGDTTLEHNRAFRKLIQRLIDVCNAISYAHSRGVLHRDLKPGNIMLGKYGETLVVDWGLAKAKGQAFDPVEITDTSNLDEEPKLSTSGSRDVVPTEMGSALGTPQFMSPEQAAGRLDLLGPSADVYSLGATLYELLTGQAPFAGLGTTEVLRRVQVGDFPRPRDVVANLPECDSAHSLSSNTKSHQPSGTSVPRLRVPLPLEAICLKAMSREPSARYATAQALAEDLERWLAGDPVLAWPEPTLVRIKRWVRRHQTLTTSAAAVLLVSIASLTALSAIVTAKNTALANLNSQISRQSNTIGQQNRSLEEANLQLRQSNAALQQSNIAERIAKGEADTKRAEAEASAKVAREQNQLALSTLNSVIFDLQVAFRNVPGGADVRQRLLAIALEKLDKVSTEFAAKSAVDRQTRAALLDLADTIVQLGNMGQVPNVPRASSAVLTAERLYRRAHEIAQQFAAAAPNDAEAQRDLAITSARLGDVLMTLGRTDDALTQFQAYEKLCRALTEAEPDNAQRQRDLSISLERLGDVFLKFGRTNDALTRFEAKLEIDRKLVEADPNHPENQHNLSATYHRLGDVFLKLGRTKDALAKIQDGLKIRRMLAEVDPSNAQRQRDLSISIVKLGDMLLAFGRTDDALTQFQEYEKLCRRLAAADPNDAANQRDLSLAFLKLGDVFLILGRTDEAVAQFQDGLKIRRELTEADPSNAQKQRDLSVALNRLGDVFLTLGRTGDALAQLQDVLKISRTLAEADPNNVQKQRDLSVSFERLGDVFLKLGRYDDALMQSQEALKISRVLAEADPNDTQKQRDLAASCNKVGDVFMMLVRTSDAFSQFQEAFQISRLLAKADADNADKQRDVMLSHYKLGEAHLQAGQYDQAQESFTQGIAVLDGMIAKGQLVNPSQQTKTILEQRRQLCRVAKLATGDWDTLLKVDPRALPQFLILRATELLKRGELEHAVQAGAKLRELDAKDKNNLYNAACVYARCAEFVTKNKPSPTDAEQAERQKLVNLALACLKESVAAGWNDFAHMQKDDDFKPLRGLPEFEALFPKKLE